MLRDNGVMTVVFGHGDPEAWYLLLASLREAGFVVTSSWPARTEAAGGADAATIELTITISCRPALANRPDGLQAAVDLEVERVVRSRIVDWERADMSISDKFMASCGPAMEVVGKYQRILRPDGSEVELGRYFTLARDVVLDAAAIKIDGLPVEIFDARSRFALIWAASSGRQLEAKSQASSVALSSGLRLEDMRKGILEESRKGYKLADFGEMHTEDEYQLVTSDLPVIDIVRYMVRAWRAYGGQGVANVLSLAEREEDDLYVWSVVSYLATVLPEADRDRKAVEDITRNKRHIVATRANLEAQRARAKEPVAEQLSLFTDDLLIDKGEE